MGESVVGYAQHLLMLTTKLNAAQADAVNPTMLCNRFIDGLHPPSLRGSNPAQHGSGRAAGPSSGSDEEDSRAAG